MGFFFTSCLTTLMEREGGGEVAKWYALKPSRTTSLPHPSHQKNTNKKKKIKSSSAMNPWEKEEEKKGGGRINKSHQQWPLSFFCFVPCKQHIAQNTTRTAPTASTLSNLHAASCNFFDRQKKSFVGLLPCSSAFSPLFLYIVCMIHGCTALYGSWRHAKMVEPLNAVVALPLSMRSSVVELT